MVLELFELDEELVVDAGGSEVVDGFTLELLVYACGEECSVVLENFELDEELVVYAGGVE